ncbi:uncharacterized protein L969DRAFT_52027 [Mixia osmundae IAM 14324]|uniref:GAF domain-containing protein n=1 Tax=Mixia osmundae (strain CBS 9802 / IAM 14324 / JCM 22182 / KY 12970) TaxID=764103 RepID=G7DX00_MIXOS|nr:uncharacterized protein L969DRAFT_52027 [Mixia osmundae IAM 14324]KEI38094.1 hypothetical protein L969DRAFT_52027 [Mixia osmundae IAM 14324]GAA95097.1 hypothetical protein E5Q_01752 [Mixia osmundae IAM 14324]
MPHADSSTVPSSVQTREAFYDHVCEQLHHLLSDGSTENNWVSALANASSLLFAAYASYNHPNVNWCGFYVHARLFGSEANDLWLAPFAGKPACQLIALSSKRPGVCAHAYNSRQTIAVPDVEAHDGHIACDAATRSEIVLPVIVQDECIGVFDLDSTEINGFESDSEGLQRYLAVLLKHIRWPEPKSKHA